MGVNGKRYETRNIIFSRKTRKKGKKTEKTGEKTQKTEKRGKKLKIIRNWFWEKLKTETIF